MTKVRYSMGFHQRARFLSFFSTIFYFTWFVDVVQSSSSEDDDENEEDEDCSGDDADDKEKKNTSKGFPPAAKNPFALLEDD